MPYSRILIHLVWSTKLRHTLLTKNIRETIFMHIQSNAQKKDIHIEQINGYVEHVHCLLSLGVDQKVSEVVKQIKGESSFWINKHKLTTRKFGWQNGFFAQSVSPRNYNHVRDYILNQEQHHKKVTFAKEYEAFIKEIKRSKLL